MQLYHIRPIHMIQVAIITTHGSIYKSYMYTKYIFFLKYFTKLPEFEKQLFCDLAIFRNGSQHTSIPYRYHHDHVNLSLQVSKW